MSKASILKIIMCEYGFGWAINRAIYAAKLKTMRLIPATEKAFEKNSKYINRLNLFDININVLTDFLQNDLSETDKVKLIQLADKATEGVIIGFGSIELNYGKIIDWQLNPITNVRCNENEKWYRIPDFDKERGDIKVVWEASRFSHFVTLARAFLLTNDIKYYEAFRSQLMNWLNMNVYSFGANYKCGQECSFRMINALLAYSVFTYAGVATDADASMMKDLVDRCYRKILSNYFYSYKCIKNNHTISELTGMIVGAWCCGDQRKLKKAYNMLEKVIDEQFLTDGGYRQLSFNYQRLALQDIEIVMSISQQTGITLSKRASDKVKNSAMLMYQCLDDSGDMPNYGHNDGSLVFPVTSCDYRDFRPVINTVYALVTGKQVFSSGVFQEELIWFSGGTKSQQYLTDSIDKVPSQFLDAGLFTFRNENSWAMIVSKEYSSRPAHMDQQHFDLWIDGINVLCDAGTYSYADGIGRQLILNKNHNTAVVEGKTQMNIKGPFMIYNWAKRTVFCADGSSYEGKIVSHNGYVHKRSVQQIGENYIIEDKVDQDYSIVFHTPCDVSIEKGRATLSVNGKAYCSMFFEGEIEKTVSYRSLFYMRHSSTTCLSFRGQAGTTVKILIHVLGGKKDG